MHTALRPDEAATMLAVLDYLLPVLEREAAREAKQEPKGGLRKITAQKRLEFVRGILARHFAA